MKAIAPAPGELFLDLSIGFFADDNGEIYIMTQNARHPGADFPFSNDSAGTVSFSFDFTGATGISTDHVLRFDPVEGLQIAVPLAGTGTPRTLNVEIDAGDVYFFKYASDRGFAGIQ